MRSILKRYRFFLFLAAINIALVFLKPELGTKSVEISVNSLVEMFIIIPPIFLLLGLFDVWVPRETIIKLMGEKSGLLGISLALALGSFAAGPLYAAFPVAAALVNKGSRFSNILIFISAWATIKIPMLLFEAGSMGWEFMLTRLLINLPGIILMAYIMEIIISDKEKELVYKNQSSF